MVQTASFDVAWTPCRFAISVPNRKRHWIEGLLGKNLERGGKFPPRRGRNLPDKEVFPVNSARFRVHAPHTSPPTGETTGEYLIESAIFEKKLVNLEEPREKKDPRILAVSPGDGTSGWLTTALDYVLRSRPISIGIPDLGVNEQGVRTPEARHTLPETAPWIGSCPGQEGLRGSGLIPWGLKAVFPGAQSGSVCQGGSETAGGGVSLVCGITRSARRGQLESHCNPLRWISKRGQDDCLPPLFQHSPPSAMSSSPDDPTSGWAP